MSERSAYYQHRTVRTPCDACEHRTRCTDCGLMCGDFAAYQDSGRVRNKSRFPTADRFDEVMGGES